MLEIRRGTKEDIVQVAAIYDHILTEEEEGRAVIGWIRGVYPTENTAKEAVKNDDLFVMTDALWQQRGSTKFRCRSMLMQTGNIRIFCRNRLWFCIRWS